MSHSYCKIWLHLIFSTKYREPLIHASVEQKIYEHMRQQLLDMQCTVRIINGMPDHVHILFLQNPRLAITDVVKQVKGNTSHWINQENIIPEKFAWQTGYGIFSVSESQLDRVYHYIRNQKEHHRAKTFEHEYDEFVLAHGLTIDKSTMENEISTTTHQPTV